MMIKDSQIDKKNLCYMNQRNLKRAGVLIPLTKAQDTELKKCAKDILYFVSNYVKILDLDGGFTLFKMRDYQKEFISTCYSNRFVISMMARQMGKTTTVVAYLLHQALTRRDIRIAILSNKADSSLDVIDRLKRAYEALPWYMQVGVKEWNKYSIELGNGAKVVAAATSSSSIRGRSFHIVYLDEFAHVENDVAFYTSTYPVISSGKTTQVIITSTPNGMNLFYKLWVEAEEKRNKFIPLLYDYTHNPNYDEEWLADTKSNMTPQEFAQEFECAFLGSAATLLSGPTLRRLAIKTPLPEFTSDKISVYEEPKPDHVYVAIADVAEGTGNDSSVVSVFDVTAMPYRHVAVYRNNLITPLPFADEVFKIAKAYNDAWLAVETNSIGNGVAQTLWMDYEYENLICYDATKGDIRFSPQNLGIRTTKKTKSIGCSNLKTLMETQCLITNDAAAITELTTFVKKGSSYQADNNKHDDVVMTLVLFALLTTTPYFRDSFNDAPKAIRNLSAQAMDEEPLFMFVVNGIDQDDTWNDSSGVYYV